MSVDIKECSPTKFNEFSKITVFEEQADCIPTIAELLNRFSGKHAEECIDMAGARCDGQAAEIIVVTPTYETAILRLHYEMCNNFNGLSKTR